MADQRRGGIIQIQVDGQLYEAKGEFTVNMGGEKRSEVIGSDGTVHGFSSVIQAPTIKGETTDRTSLDLQTLINIQDATVTLALDNGKVFSMRNAWYSADGEYHTTEGNFQMEFTGKSLQVVA